MEIFKNGKNEFVHIGRGIMVPSLVHTHTIVQSIIIFRLIKTKWKNIFPICTTTIIFIRLCSGKYLNSYNNFFSVF